jgi:Flp pilus assembly protein TadB
METFTHLPDWLLQTFVQFGEEVGSALFAVEGSLRYQLTQIGLPHRVQTFILLTTAAFLVVWSVRLFGGVIRMAAVSILLLLGIQIIRPLL